MTGETSYKTLKDKNREPKESHIVALMKSFIECGTACATVIVIRTKAFSGIVEEYIIDGQHTIVACNRLGLSYTVIIVELENDIPLNVTKYIATLNNNAKAWSTNNFLASFAANGIREYKTLEVVLRTSGLTITDLLYIFLGGGGKKENDLFKSGNLSFINEDDSINLLNAIQLVKPYIPNKAYVRRSLYKIMRLANDYNKLAKAIVKTAKIMETKNDKFSENELEFHTHITRIYQKEFKVK